MPPTSPLPPNWTLVLEQIHDALTQAVQRAEAREANLDALAPGERATMPRLGMEQALDNRAAAAEAPLAELDQVLGGEEEFVRQHLAAVATLRERLTTWETSLHVSQKDI